MRLRSITRATKLELFHSDEDFVSFLFVDRKTQLAARLFLKELKHRNGLTRAELSHFVGDLQHGKIEKGFTFSRSAFYTTIRRILLLVGLITIEQRAVNVSGEWSGSYGTVKEKYVPVIQPITRKPPDGVTFMRFAWILSKQWNNYFLNKKKSCKDRCLR